VERKRNREIQPGWLVRPTFNNEYVLLFPRDPTLDVAVGGIVGEFGPIWAREATGIVLETRGEGTWVRILVPSGCSGWIGEWNIDRVA
jgi:hypothetical protein